MLGIVLEGGGARGAYQAGVIKCFISNGYIFDGITGTSIGALNGVMLAQGRFDESYELWEEMEFSRLFDFEEKYAEKIGSMNLDKDTVKYFLSKLREAISNKGLDTSKIRALLQEYIDEDKLRNSGKDFGLTTFSFKEMKPYQLFIEDMPEGTVADYVMASANFPGFAKMKIDDKVFIDGGIYDNLPINMLVDKGYRDLIAIETQSSMRKQKCKDDTVQVVYIRPSEKPGRMLAFMNESVARGMKIGRYDAMRYLKGYIGTDYYIKLDKASPFGYGLEDMKKSAYTQICKVYGIKSYPDDIRKTLKEIKIHLEKVNRRKYNSAADALLHIVEKIAAKLEIERLEVYSIKDFFTMVYDSYQSAKINGQRFRTSMDMRALEIINKFYF